jgi:hypothetical protein
MSNFLPDKDRDLVAWANNFITVATANLDALGLLSSDLTGLVGGAADMGTDLDTMTGLKAQFEAQVADKNDTRSFLESSARTLAKRIQAKGGVSTSLKVALGINANTGTRNRTAPVQPATLVATPQADGTNALHWNKAGNKQNTQYAVLAKSLTEGASVTADTDWTMVGLTTASRFKHNGVTPGSPMAYKVMAVRAGNSSLPSLPVTVYTS